MRLWAWGQSDPGRKRERNEDSYLVDPETGVLGGRRRHGRPPGRRDREPDGGRASSRRELAEARGDFDARARAAARLGDVRDDRGDAARSTTPTRPTRAPAIAAARPSDRSRRAARGAVVLAGARGDARRRARAASSAIFEAAWAKPELRGMGTTLTAMLVHGGTRAPRPRRRLALLHVPRRPAAPAHRGPLVDRRAATRRLDHARPRRSESKFRHVITQVDRLRARHRGRHSRACRCRRATASCCAPTACRTTSSTASSSGSSR